MSTFAKYKLVGFKRFQDNITDEKTGQPKYIDSGTLFVEIRLNDRRNGPTQWASGLCTEALKLPSGDLVKRFEGIPLPCNVIVETERMSNGKVSREEVVAVELDAPDSPAPKAADPAAAKPARVPA